MKFRFRLIADGQVLKQAVADFPNAKAAEREVFDGVLEPGCPADPLLQALRGEPIRWVEMEAVR